MTMLSLYAIIAVPFLMAVIGSLLLSLAVRIHSFFRSRAYLPKLHYRESTLTRHLLSKCRLRERVFSPSFWIRNPHVQSVLAAICPSFDVNFDREYLQMRDKGVVALDWVVSVQPKIKRKRTILLIIPSITGSALGVSALCYDATQRGFKAVVFNRRGHGGSVLTTAKLQSSGDPSDLRQVVKYIRLKFPRCKLAAVGYGTGCGLLISYLGEFGSSALISVGACVSPCYDACERFSMSMRSMYDYMFLLFLKVILCRHARALSGTVDVKQALKAWTFHKYEEDVYCRIYGYESMDEFWERNNPIRDVDDISVPVLCINSLDDPFYAKSNIPYDLFKYYPNFLLVATEKGGHCGFLEGFPPKSWADNLCLDYIEAVFEFTTKGYGVNNRGAVRSTI
ncbi:protein ABHD15-like [Haliotis rubra]|uniref:protein ABHD15-like n=1 Tax=Haliotis rubra TaxID=36100 RepID=UPI001EE5F722|nr:protein ABHD15-like [Haliotis rubra]